MRLHILIPVVIVFSTTTASAQRAIDLFPNDSFELWTAQNGGTVPEGWSVQDGLVHFDPARGKGGNIVTAAEYGDFELSFQFRIGPKGNSGIKYRVRRYGNRILGCEYQILDDPAYSTLKPTQFTASLYDIKEPTNGRLLAGEFNSGRIVVRKGWIEHWLNGRLVVSTYVGSRDWTDRVEKSKFKAVDDFSRNQMGRLMLTDHNSEVWYRNVTLTLPTPTGAGSSCCCRQRKPRCGIRTRRCRIR